MDTIEQIKKDMIELTERISKVEAADAADGTFTFTKEQLLKFARLIESGLIEDIKEEIMNSDVDVEEHIEIEFDSYNKQISLDIDNERINRSFADAIEDEMIDDEFIISTAGDVKIDMASALDIIDKL